MHQAIPYSAATRSSPLRLMTSPTKTPTTTLATAIATDGPTSGNVLAMVLESPVVVLGARDCCLCLVIRRLLSTLGVSPLMCEVNEGDAKAQEELKGLQAVVKCCDTGNGGASLLFPAVFIGGRHVGGLEQLLGLHISGNLVPTLKKAGALWL